MTATAFVSQSAQRETIAADALALQERDQFRADGWLKVIAPAKVNLFLGIGARRPDGYHEAHTVMHALALHDILYLRRKTPLDETYASGEPEVQLVSCMDVEVPAISSADNLAFKAIKRLEAELQDASLAVAASEAGTFGDEAGAFGDLVLRIEKHIPFQGGLGGASADAAAALVGAAAMNGIAPDHPALERAARGLGADICFFLRGGCAYLEGTGDMFVHALQPGKKALVLIKPAGGVSTAAAYRTFDEHPLPIDPALLARASSATVAADVPLFNNLAPAAESLMPELAAVRNWALARPGVTGAQLCGSGATTFALCEDAAAAFKLVADARHQGLWAHATSLCALSAAAVGNAGAACAVGSAAPDC